MRVASIDVSSYCSGMSVCHLLKLKTYFGLIHIIPPHWCLHLIVVRRFEYAGDPESYTSGSVATGRASLAGQVKG